MNPEPITGNRSGTQDKQPFPCSILHLDAVILMQITGNRSGTRHKTAFYLVAIFTQDKTTLSLFNPSPGRMNPEPITGNRSGTRYKTAFSLLNPSPGRMNPDADHRQPIRNPGQNNPFPGSDHLPRTKQPFPCLILHLVE